MIQSLYIEIIVNNICNDIKKARDKGILAGSVILALSAIDAMAFLASPIKQRNVTRDDYINWVQKYMKTDSSQSYQYRGIDVYGARCGIVHRYGAESDLSDKDKCRVFVYSNRSEHIYNPAINKDMVIISIYRFTNDFFRAVKEFLKDIAGDPHLKTRTDGRIMKLFRVSKKQKLKNKRITYNI